MYFLGMSDGRFVVYDENNGEIEFWDRQKFIDRFEEFYSSDIEIKLFTFTSVSSRITIDMLKETYLPKADVKFALKNSIEVWLMSVSKGVEVRLPKCTERILNSEINDLLIYTMKDNLHIWYKNIYYFVENDMLNDVIVCCGRADGVVNLVSNIGGEVYLFELSTISSMEMSKSEFKRRLLLNRWEDYEVLSWKYK